MDQTVDSFRSVFQEQSATWMANLQPAAMWLLITLATISITWRFIQIVLQGGKVELGDILVELVRLCVLVGMVSYLIVNAPYLTDLLLRSAAAAAAVATGTSPVLDATAILDAGVNIGEQLMEAAGVTTIIFAALAAFLIVGLYAGIAAFVLVCYIEFYVVSAAGILFLGLAGAPWTSEIAKHYIQQLAGSAAKLYVLFLIVGLGTQLVGAWVVDENAEINFGEILYLFGAVLVLFCITFMLPAIVHGIIAGSSVGAMGPLAMMQTAMSAATSLAGGAFRAGMATKEAGAAAVAQAGASSLRGAAKAAGGGMVGPARVAGSVGKNLAAAAFTTVAGKALAGSVAETLRAQRVGGEAPATAPGEGGTIKPSGEGDG